MASSSSLPKCDFADDCDGQVILGRQGQVLDPELDEPILRLGFVRAIHVRDGQAVIALQLPTSWCAVNFAYLMAEDIRHALVAIDGIDRVTVHLGDHCAGELIEAAVNKGKTFMEAFPGEGSSGFTALRRVLLARDFRAAKNACCATSPPASLLFWLGPDKLCFGSDYAIWTPKWLIEKFMAYELPKDLKAEYHVDLTVETKPKILGENAARLYGIDIPAKTTKLKNDAISAAHA